MAPLEEYRVALDFRPRVQLLSTLAAALEEFEPELSEILVAPSDSGVMLVVRCESSDDPPVVRTPTRTAGRRGAAASASRLAAPPAAGRGAVASADAGGGRRRRGVPRRSEESSTSSTEREPGALGAHLVELLRLLHTHDGSIADASGAATVRIREAMGWSPYLARTVVAEAQSIGLVSRRSNATKTFQVALTPVGQAAYDRLPDVDEASPRGRCRLNRGGGAVDATARGGGVSDEVVDRRRAAAAAAM